MDKRKRLSRLSGVVFLVSAIMGVIISLGGLVVLWSTRASITKDIVETTALVRRSLAATSSSLVLINDSLDQASRNIALIHELIGSMAGTLSDSKDMLDTAANMVGTDMKGIVAETQKSLLEVEDSARMVDSALRVVDSSLQFLNRLRPGSPAYKPRVPLQDSIAQVSLSLDPLSATFEKIQKQLDNAAAHAATMQAEADALSRQVAEIQSSLDQARSVSTEYRTIIDDLDIRLDTFEQQLPLRLTMIYLGVTLLLLWVFTSSAGMLLNGLGLLRE
jgi:methyl-accepting chemotaxis protein